MTMAFIVDNVCLHSAKQTEVTQHHEGLIQKMIEAGASEAEISRQRELM